MIATSAEPRLLAPTFDDDTKSADVAITSLRTALGPRRLRSSVKPERCEPSTYDGISSKVDDELGTAPVSPALNLPRSEILAARRPAEITMITRPARPP